MWLLDVLLLLAGAGWVGGLVRGGDAIWIDVPARTIEVEISGEELAVRRERREAMTGYRPRQPRPAGLRRAACVRRDGDLR